MAYYRKIAALLLMSGVLFPFDLANAAVLTMSGEQITIEGRILDADVDKYIELSHGKSITRVIFRASLGGQWRAVKWEFSTSAEGNCHASAQRVIPPMAIRIVNFIVVNYKFPCHCGVARCPNHMAPQARMMRNMGRAMQQIVACANALRQAVVNRAALAAIF